MGENGPGVHSVPRLFVAVDLPETVRLSLSDLAFGLPGAKWLPPEQLHVTLAFIGEVDGGRARDVREALRSVRAAPFELSLLGLGHFPHRGEPRVAWAGLRASERLSHLHRAVVRQVESTGLELEHRKFHPHVTLARLRGTPPHRLADWLAMNGAFQTGSFEVTALILYSSVLGSSGATHQIEEAYPFGIP